MNSFFSLFFLVVGLSVVVSAFDHQVTLTTSRGFNPKNGRLRAVIHHPNGKKTEVMYNKGQLSLIEPEKEYKFDPTDVKLEEADVKKVEFFFDDESGKLNYKVFINIKNLAVAQPLDKYHPDYKKGGSYTVKWCIEFEGVSYFAGGTQRLVVCPRRW